MFHFTSFYSFCARIADSPKNSRRRRSRRRRNSQRLPGRKAYFEHLEDRRVLAAVFWDGGAGTLNWNDAQNWSTDAVPGLTDDVAINVPDSEVTILHASGNTRIQSLTSRESLEIGGNSSISVGDSSVVYGSLANVGTLTVESGTLNLHGGGTSSGSFVGNPGTTLIFGSAPHVLDANSSISGDVVWFAPDKVETVVGGSFHASGRTIVSSGSFGQVTFSGTVTGVGDSLYVGGGTVGDFGGNSLTVATLNVQGGRLLGAGNVAVTEEMTFHQGVLSGTGSTNVAADALLTILGNNQIREGYTLENRGTAVWMASALTLGEGTQFINSGSFDAQSDGVFSPSGDGNAFINTGTFVKSGGTGELTFRSGQSSAHVGLLFDNHGTVQVTTGTLGLRGGGTSSGSFVGGPAATLTFGAEHELTATSSISASEVNFFSVTAVVRGNYQVSERTALNHADVSFTQSKIGLGDSLAMFGSAIDLANNSVTVAELDLNASVLTGTGDVTVTEQMAWRFSSMNGSGSTIIASEATLEIYGNASNQLRDGRTLLIRGEAAWKDGGGINLADGAQIHNEGVFDAQADASLQGTVGTAFINSGLFKKTTGANETAFIKQVAFENSGTVRAQSGMLTFHGGFIQTAGRTILDGGNIWTTTELDIHNGQFSGSGTVIGSIVSEGDTTPGFSPGEIAVTGDFTQTSAGTLTIQIGGLAAGTEHDQLDVIGTVALAGELDVSMDGFLPSVGDSFTIINNEGTDDILGTFDSLPEGTVLAAGDVQFRISYQGDDGNPDPAAVGNDVVLTVTAIVQTVDIDVKPGSDNDTVNLAANGVLPVVIYTTTSFDASTVDVGTVIFAGAYAAQSALEDVDGDGDLDLVFHFRIQEMVDLEPDYRDALRADLEDNGILDDNHQNIAVTLRGRTSDGTLIKGTDTIDAFFAGKALTDVLNSLQ